MIFMITKKGQSALETLLVLGGVVVVATIILAVALNTGSENASVVRQKSEESTDILKSSDVYPSTINSIKCLNENTYLIMWSPFTNPDYNYSIIYAGIELEFTANPFLVAEKNPISFSKSDVNSGQQSLIKNCTDITTEYIAIKTTNKSGGSRSSNLYYLVPQTEIPKVGAITFSPNGGSFNNSIILTLSCSTSGATIRYTTDGSDPTSASAEYQNSITLDSTGQVKARAFKDGYDASDIFTKNFNFSVAQIIPDPKEGNIEPGIKIKLSTVTINAEIRYTTDDKQPSCSNGETYKDPIQIDTTTTINAIGCKTGYTPSAIMTETYTISLSTPINYFIIDESLENVTLTLNPDISPTEKTYLRLLDKELNVIGKSDSQSTLELVFNSQDSPYIINTPAIGLDLSSYYEAFVTGNNGNIQIMIEGSEKTLAEIDPQHVLSTIGNELTINESSIVITLSSNISPEFLAGPVFLRFLNDDGEILAESNQSSTVISDLLKESSPYTIDIDSIKLDLTKYVNAINESNNGDVQIIDATTNNILAIIDVLNITKG